MSNDRIDLKEMVSLSTKILSLNLENITIDTETEWESFNFFKNHVCTKLTLTLPTIESFQQSPTFCNPLKVLVLNTPLLKDFPYALIRDQPQLEKFSLASDVVDELRYNFVEQRSTLQTLHLELPSLTFLYWGVFRTLRESLTKLSIQNCSKLPQVPPTIGVLQQLQELDLINCNISDQNFPREIAFLLNLQVLNLGSNQLTTIPDELALVFSLKSLCVCYNKIKLLPPWIVTSELNALCVGHNDFTKFPTEIERSTTLNFFNYNGNTIEGDFIILSKNNYKQPLQIASSYNVVYFSPSQYQVYINAQKLELRDYDTIPKDFICPITQSIMIDPVITVNGETYENHAIRQWFQTNINDPLTNKRLKNKKLTRNLVLSRLIRAYVEKTTKK